MNIKELHNPTFRQEDNRLYLVGNTMEKPNEDDYTSYGYGLDLPLWDNAHRQWLQSEVKYLVRESSEEAIKLNLRSHTLYTPWTFNNRIVEGIPVPPELMERLVLNKSIVSLCEESCDNSWCKTRGCMNPVNGDDVRLEVTLKEEPKGESEDELWKELIDVACITFTSEAKGKLKDIYKSKFTITRKQP